MSKIYLNKSFDVKHFDEIPTPGCKIKMKKKYCKIHKIIDEFDYLPDVLSIIIKQYVDDDINIIIKKIHNWTLPTPYNCIFMSIYDTYINCESIVCSYELFCKIENGKYKYAIRNYNKNYSFIKYDYLTASNLDFFNKFMKKYYKKNNYIETNAPAIETYYQGMLTDESKEYTITNKKLMKNVIVIFKIILDTVLKKLQPLKE
jgi:hypothetical protein